MVKPLVRRLPLGSPQGLLGLQRIVNDDDVGATSSQHPADRGGEPAALCRRLELRHGPPLGGETGPEGPLIPAARGDAAAITGELVGEILPPGYARDRPSPSKPGGDTEDLRAGLVFEAPRRKRHRAQQRFQIARQHIDNQPAPERTAVSSAAMTSTYQFIANATSGLSARKQAFREGSEIQPQLGLLLAPGERLADNATDYEHNSRWRAGILATLRRKAGVYFASARRFQGRQGIATARKLGSRGALDPGFPHGACPWAEGPLTTTGTSAGGASGSRYLTGVTSRLRPHPGWHLEPRLELGRDLLVRRADGGGKSGRRARLRLEVQHPPMRDR